jgi:hypothetical protein
VTFYYFDLDSQGSNRQLVSDEDFGEYRCIRYLDGLLLLVDPDDLSTDKIPGFTQVVSVTLAAVRQWQQRGLKHKISLPLAVVITEANSQSGQILPGSSTQPPSHEQCREALCKSRVANEVSALENHFRAVRYFASSAAYPTSALSPLLWLFEQLDRV